MRPSRRFLPWFYAIFVVLFLTLGAPAAHAQSAQSPPNQLPSKWSEAVHALADRIAAASPAHATLVLDVKNLSSLSTHDASNIREAIQTEWMRRGFRLGSATAAGTEVRLTLSEGIDSYVWVAEWPGKDEPKVAIVGVPKASIAGESGTKDLLRLESKLIWQQPARLLDFAVLTNPATVSTTLITLEPGRLVFYLSADSQWRFSDATDIPHSKPWPRDVRGIIDVEGKKVLLPDVQCAGDLENPKEIRCVPSKDTSLLEGPRIRVSGHDESESALLGDRCDGRFIILASGNGDWTQPDSIQGYSLADLGGQATPAGSPIEFDGPVMLMYRDGKQTAARVVLRNLKTGNYEAYIVTATCSH
jgi:hypothetical protein